MTQKIIKLIFRTKSNVSNISYLKHLRAFER